MRGMRALVLEVPTAWLDERRRLGLDRRDEVWAGELHMVPPPHHAHGSLNDGLGEFFRPHWQRLGLGRTFVEVGVARPGTPRPGGGGPGPGQDYRVPDRAFLLPERLDRLVGGWIVGGPDVVLEIVSPDDESRAKLPFYRSIGVREVVLVDRDTRAVELFTATEAGFAIVAPDAAGWVRSEILRTELRAEPGPAGGPPALVLRRWDEPARTLRIDD